MCVFNTDSHRDKDNDVEVADDNRHDYGISEISSKSLFTAVTDTAYSITIILGSKIQPLF